MEYMSLQGDYDSQDGPKFSEWTSVVIQSIKKREYPLMALINKRTIMIYGGFSKNRLANGVLIDIDTKQGVQNLSSGDLRF